MGQCERLVDHALDPYAPLLGWDVRKSAVIAAVESIHRGDLTRGQYLARRLGIERQPFAHNEIGALTPCHPWPFRGSKFVCWGTVAEADIGYSRLFLLRSASLLLLRALIIAFCGSLVVTADIR
jgi:hypothetical protein